MKSNNPTEAPHFSIFRGKKSQFYSLTCAAIAAAMLVSSCSDLQEEVPIQENSIVNTAPSDRLRLVETPDRQLRTITAKSGSETNANMRATTAGGNDKGRFNLTLRYVTSVTERQQEVFENAAARWERIIIGDVPSITAAGFVIPSAFVGFPPVLADGETLDDVIIEVAIAPIDGPGQILGQAGPRYIRNVDELTLSGVMFFDVADLDQLDALELFEDVIVHEMGHVLGIGTLWNTTSRALRQGPTANPYFAGKMANTHWKASGGTNFLPVENIGGAGTAGSHWREATLGNELMTGYLNLGENPLSRITAGSVRDLGYKSAMVGEQFKLPKGTAGVAARTEKSLGINIAEMEELLPPVGIVVID